MALLFSVIDFPELSRMTGIWTNRTLDADAGDEVIIAQLVVFPPYQDPVVESDFLCSHLPFHVGGFHGVFPDGQGWMVVLLAAPASVSTELMSASESAWALVDSIDRALRFNYGAEAMDWAVWRREELVQYYVQSGAEADALLDWSVAELLWGLLAECCNVPLGNVVTGYQTGCALPDVQHDCEGHVFNDVFAMWTTRALNSPEPDLDEIYGGNDDDAADSSDEAVVEFTRWTRKQLKKLKRRELMGMAIADGWEWSDLNGVRKKVLITLMIDGQLRPPDVDRARSARVRPHDAE